MNALFMPRGSVLVMLLNYGMPPQVRADSAEYSRKQLKLCQPAALQSLLVIGILQRAGGFVFVTYTTNSPLAPFF